MTAGAVSVVGLLGAVTRAPMPEGPAGLARGIGTKVMVFGTPVMIPGFSAT